MMPEPNNPQLQEPRRYENERFQESYHESSGNIQTSLTDMQQTAYPLIELEYYKILKGENPITRYTWEFFIITAGYFVLLIAKLIGRIKIENWEWNALIIAIVIFIILQFLVKWFFPSDQKEVLSKIQRFFTDNQPSFITHQKL